MPIVASGTISLGGNATISRSVACELFRSGTAAICMDESEVRTLAARTTAASAICMNNFYSKSNGPTALGQFKAGGYYTGTVSSPANYYLFVAPNASGCAKCTYRTASGSSGLTFEGFNGVCNENNGYFNTFTYLNSSTHPAGNWTATRSINGFSDWYLPATCEMCLLYTGKDSMPAGEEYKTCCYWSSTECSNYNAMLRCMQFSGTAYSRSKYTQAYVRATRRVAF